MIRSESGESLDTYAHQALTSRQIPRTSSLSRHSSSHARGPDFMGSEDVETLVQPSLDHLWLMTF